MSTSFKKMVLMPFDMIKNKRNLAKGYEKLPNSKNPPAPPPEDDKNFMEMTSSTSKLTTKHKPTKKSKKHKKKLSGKWKIFN
jgi:hypothetical protein